MTNGKVRASILLEGLHHPTGSFPVVTGTIFHSGINTADQYYNRYAPVLETGPSLHISISRQHSTISLITKDSQSTSLLTMVLCKTCVHCFMPPCLGGLLYSTGYKPQPNALIFTVSLYLKTQLMLLITPVLVKLCKLEGPALVEIPEQKDMFEGFSESSTS
jgi:hypothetical protein